MLVRFYICVYTNVHEGWCGNTHTHIPAMIAVHQGCSQSHPLKEYSKTKLVLGSAVRNVMDTTNLQIVVGEHLLQQVCQCLSGRLPKLASTIGGPPPFENHHQIHGRLQCPWHSSQSVYEQVAQSMGRVSVEHDPSDMCTHVRPNLENDTNFDVKLGMTTHRRPGWVAVASCTSFQGLVAECLCVCMSLTSRKYSKNRTAKNRWIPRRKQARGFEPLAHHLSTQLARPTNTNRKQQSTYCTPQRSHLHCDC
jgi:hypothetical protein